MKRSSQIVARSVAFVTLAALALAVAVLATTTESVANNPPSTLLGTVAIDPTDDPAASDPTPVWAIVEGNGRYYVGGQFTEVGGEPQAYLAAIEVATGRLDPTFRPVIAGTSNTEVLALALSPDGQDLYVGGRFTTIDGIFRDRIAKLDAFDGSVDSTFDADASAAVEAIDVDSSGVFVGGIFTTIGGGTSPNLAKLDDTTGALDPLWTATADARVRDLEVSGTDVYVGGAFTTIAGQAVAYLALLDSTTGALSPSWAPQYPESQVILSLSVSPDGSTVYAGTAGSAADTPLGGNAVRAYTATGTTLWQRIGSGNVQAVTATSDTVYVGSHGEALFEIARYNIDGSPNDGSVNDTNPNDPSFPANGYVEDPNVNPNAIKREKFSALDSTTGDILPWDPDGDSVNGVWSLEIGPSGLLAGGDFTEIVNPTGVPGTADTIFTPHFAVFPNIGALDAAPEPLFTVDCAGTSCNFDAALATDDSGTITSYAWDFGDGQTATGTVAGVLLANDTIHTVSLTVTDPAGNSATRQEQVVVGTGGLPVAPVGASSLNQASNLFVQQIPATAQVGDLAIAFITVNTTSAATTAPAGWTLIADETHNLLRTYIYSRTLTAGEPGTNAAFEVDPPGKAALTLSVFSGAGTAVEVVALETVGESEPRVGHRAPALDFDGEASIVHYWANRSGQNTEFAAPGSEATLTSSFGVGGGHISTLLSMATSTASGSSPQSVAVAEHHGMNAHGFSLAIALADGLTVLSDPVACYDSTVAGGTFTGGEVRSVQVAGVGGCVPAGASSVVFTVSSVDPLTEGNLRMTPAGVVATGGAGVVNYGAANGLNNINTVTVPLSDLGAVDIEANSGPAGAVPTTDVRLLAVGYYSPDVAPDTKFFVLNPCAVADSRTNKSASDAFDGPNDDGYWPVGGAFPDVDVVGSFPVGQGGGNTTCSVPTGADAVLVNVVTIAPQNGSGFVSAGVGGVDPGVEAVASFAPLTPVVAGGFNNGATTIIPLGGGETIALDIDGSVPAAQTRLRVEVLGYFDVDSAGLDFAPVDPCAAFDSRVSKGAAGSFANERLHGVNHATTYQISGDALPVGQGGVVDAGNGFGSCGVPDGAQAVLINLEGVNALQEGNFWVAAATTAPGAATSGGVLNFNNVTPKMNNANTVVVPLSADGKIDLEVNAGSFTADGTPITQARGVILGYYN